MCLILFSWDNHPQYKLILAANRDEFYERPTDPIHSWQENSNIIAGKDLTGGGTWMGVSKQNKFAAITNHRNPTRILQDAPSRGDLTLDFLKDTVSEENYYTEKSRTLDQYNGFNLLVGSFNKMSYFNNVDGNYQELKKGIYGLSNAVLDTPWPKLSKAKNAFAKVVDDANPAVDDFYKILQDKTLADDAELPQTGVPYEWEKAISAVYIEKENYGTCCSTVVTVTHDGAGKIHELSYPVGNRKAEEKIIDFDWSSFK
ncbi:MAG: NRDE family protein [Bacteroidota bacterium]